MPSFLLIRLRRGVQVELLHCLGVDNFVEVRGESNKLPARPAIATVLKRSGSVTNQTQQSFSIAA